MLPSRSCRDRARVPRERLRADWRRDGRDAGLLRGRRVRHRRLHRRRRRAQPAGGRASDRAGRRADRPAIVRPAYQRLLAGPARVLRGLRLDARTPCCRSSGSRSATRCWRRIVRTCVPSVRCSRRGSSRAWRTSPAAASPRTCPACCRRAARAQIDRRALGRAAAIFNLLQHARPNRRRRDVSRVQHGHRADPRLRRGGCRIAVLALLTETGESAAMRHRPDRRRRRRRFATDQS